MTGTIDTGSWRPAGWGREILRAVLGLVGVGVLVFVGTVGADEKGEDQGAVGIWEWRFDLPNGNQLGAWMQVVGEQDGEISGFYGSGGAVLDLKGALMAKDGVVEFEALTEIEGAPSMVKYSGKRVGDRVSGTAELSLGGESRVWSWEAGRVSGIAGLTGTWGWSIEMKDGRTFSPQLRLVQHGSQVEGVLAWSGKSERAISEGRVVEDKFLFELVRERNGKKLVSSFEGTIDGDLMTGKVTSKWGEQERVYDLEATRAPAEAAKE